MKNLDSTTIEFVDGETQDQGVAIVRDAGGFIGLALSLARDGDIEVLLAPADAQRIADALAAVARAGGTD